MRHQDLTINHRLESWVFANAAARLAAGSYVSGDVGRIGYETDNGTYWRLLSTTPTWQLLSGDEYLVSTRVAGSALALTTNVALSLNSISLTAGNWDVTGVIGFTFGAGTLVTVLSGAANTGSASFDGLHQAQMSLSSGATPASTILMALPVTRITFASPASMYLNAFALFTVSTCSVFGEIRATRAG